MGIHTKDCDPMIKHLLPFIRFCAFVALCTGVQAQVADTRFSPDRGFYASPTNVVIQSDTPGALISYTTDGSNPVASGGQPSPVVVPVNRSLPLRAMAYLASGALPPSNIDTHTYVMLNSPAKWDGKTYTTSAAYPPDVVTSLHHLPALFISMPNSDFATVRDSGTGGIGNSGGNEQYERPCSLELHYPQHPKFKNFRGFQINCGLRPHSWVTTKRAFRIYFKRDYGAGKLNYPLFESAPYGADSATTSFDKIVLRHHSNDGWEGRWGASPDALYLRDQFARAAQYDMGGTGGHSTWAHLFVNGAYYGLYNPSERPDNDFQASYEGGNGDDYLGFNHGGNINEEAPTTIKDAAYNPGDLSNPATYATYRDVMDVSQFSDYLISSWWNLTHAHDWPVNGSDPQNYYGGNNNNPGRGVKHFTWDFEASLVWNAEVHTKFKRSSTDKDRVFIKPWFALVENPEFMMLFADRTYRHLYNRGALASDVSTDRLKAMSDWVRPALDAEIWQWGSKGQNNWDNRLGTAFAHCNSNSGNLITSMRAENYYPDLDPPVYVHNSLAVKQVVSEVPSGYLVQLTNPNAQGTIYYTTDGSDPRLTGGAVSGMASIANNLTLTITNPMQLKSRVFNAGEWSAIHEAFFVTPQDYSALKITEIMYNPLDQALGTTLAITQIVGDAGGDDFARARISFGAALPVQITSGDKITIHGALNPANNGTFTIHHVDGTDLLLSEVLSNETGSAAMSDFLYDGDRYDFVEIKNTGSTTIDLSGVQFTKGLRFGFQPGDTINPGAFKVLASQSWRFGDRYPGIVPDGSFPGGLDNQGEKLELAFGRPDLLAVQSIQTDTNGISTIAFTAPPNVAIGDRVQLLMASNVVNNGDFQVLAVNGNTLTVDGDFSTEGAGAQGRFFQHITSVKYDDRSPWSLSADGYGYSLVPLATNPTGDQNDPTTWRASALTNGSPGANDSIPGARPAILVNEALTHTDFPQVDTVELYNPTAGAVNLNGWWLTDDRKVPQKYAIGAVTIPSGGYATFLEDNDGDPLNNASLPPSFFGDAFSLSSKGEQVYLFSPDLSYSHGYSFGGAANGVSFGRYVTSIGEEHFVAQASNTLGSANANPRAGEVVITEFNYHPIDGDHEFIELQNISGGTVNLFNSTNTWEVNGVGFRFPPGVSLFPGEAVLLIRDTITPAAFATLHSVPGGTRMYSYAGKLDNAGETLTLLRPDNPDPDGVPYIVVDQVKYGELLPWPTSADGGGMALQRLTPENYGNDVINWNALPPEPGIVDPPTEPLIAVSPAAFNLTFQEESSPADQAFEIWNAGIDTLNYTLSESIPWLSLSPTSGTSTDNLNKQTHSLSFSTAALPVGMHNGTITVTANAANSPVIITVHLEVTERDRLPPTIQSLEARNGTTMEIVFNEALDAASATNSSLYAIDQGITVTSAFLENDGRTVTLTMSPLTGGASYQLTITGVADVSGNAMAATSVPFDYADILVPNGLVAYWPFEEGAGSTTEDVSGNGHVGTLNSATWSSDGKFGNAVAFDGVDDFVDVGTLSVGGTALTLSAWFNADDFGVGDARLISKAVDHGVEDHWFMLSTVTGNGMVLRARLKTGGSVSDTYTPTSGSFTANEWVHAVLVYDGSTVKLYKDGAEVGSWARSGTLDINNAVAVYIGNNPGPNPKPFDGLMDDVRIYDRALSLAEVQTLYTATPPSISTVQLTATDDSASEAGNPGELTITRSDFLSSAITVNLAISGSAAAGSDYTALPTSIVLPAGVATRTMAVLPIDDEQTEGTEDIQVSLLPGVGYVLGSLRSGTVQISDDDFTAGWLDTNRPFRVLLTGAGNGYARIDKPLEADVDFASILSQSGASGALNPDSLRMVEVDLAGNILNPSVAFQVDAGTGQVDRLIWIMDGNTGASQTRYFHVYFAAGGTFTPVSQPDQVALTDNILHEAQDSYRIITPMGTWYYHKLGAGFASLEDTDGNDWIGYHPTGGATGSYRGIPNLEFFHPGLETSTSQIVHDGPIKATITSATTDGDWACRWEMYPRYAVLTITKAPSSYWFLYEGTPGGAINGTSDTITRANGSTTAITESWDGDLTNASSEEWLYFSDGPLTRSIFIAHEEDDAHIDSYWQMQGDAGMTVFGFGRQNLNTYLTATPNRFIVGLVDDETLAPMQTAIYSAYKELPGAEGALEIHGDTDADAMADQWELNHFGRINDPQGDPTADMDLDGMNTFAEFYADTNPQDPTSKLAVMVLDSSLFGNQLSWQSRPNKTYTLRASPALSLPFNQLIANGIPATPPLNVYTNLPPANAQMFYRIEVE
jgi:hypothetical protein